MALEATHVKFALAVKEDYNVLNEQQYILGTSYPDSRYLTGIAREFTHNGDILRKEFPKNDFEKGWQVHCLCDLVQYHALKKFVTILQRYGKDWTEEKWVDYVAIKMIEDMLDWQSFDIMNYLNYLINEINPNNEEIERIVLFNKYLRNLYSGEMAIDNYYKALIEIGVQKDRAIKSAERAKELIKNEEIVNQLQDVFPYMVKNYKEFIK